MDRAYFADKNILVCGMARSGISAALLLCAAGARVTLQDIKERGAFTNELDILRGNDIKLLFGQQPDGTLLTTTSAIVLSPGIPSDLPFLQTARAMGIPVISEIELGYIFCDAPVIAITGTNGKTTTTALTAEIFKRVNATTTALGNIGSAFTSRAAELTAHDYAVVETSSFQLENIASFKPKAAAVLNITPDHLDRHKTMEHYISIKERIFLNQDSDDWLALNYDDPACRAMAAKARSRVIYFSVKQALDRGIYVDGNAIVYRQTAACEKIIDLNNIKLTGDHFTYDVMAACALALCFDVPVNVIAEAVRSFNGVPHRLEFVAEINGVVYYNDSIATNTGAAMTALSAMKRPAVLICGGYDKNAVFGEWVGMFESKVKRAVIIGDTAEKIIAACNERGFARFVRAKSLEQAVRIANAAALPGEAVLLSPACASWDMFRDFEERGDLFRAYVKNLSD